MCTPRGRAARRVLLSVCGFSVDVDVQGLYFNTDAGGYWSVVEDSDYAIVELADNFLRFADAEERQRLDVLVEETRAIATEDNDKMFRRLHQCAKLVRKGKTSPPEPATPQPEGLRSVLLVGIVGGPGLGLVRLEVLGGLPSWRRGH